MLGYMLGNMPARIQQNLLQEGHAASRLGIYGIVKKWELEHTIARKPLP